MCLRMFLCGCVYLCCRVGRSVSGASSRAPTCDSCLAIASGQQCGISGSVSRQYRSPTLAFRAAFVLSKPYH